MVRTLAALICMLPLLASGASFDCSKATTAVEKTICANTELSRLDDTLAEAFAFEIDQGTDADRLRSTQRAWLADRNLCTAVPCLKKSYERRIAAIACDVKSIKAGSAIGSSQCSYFSLRVLEAELQNLEDRYTREASTATDNPEYTTRTAKAEQKAWRAYREAKCALYGATEGGSDGWKNAYAGMCEVTETEARIAKLKRELAVK